MEKPPRLIFLRIVLIATVLLSLGALADTNRLAHELGITVSASLTWLGIYTFLIVLSVFTLVVFGWSFTSTGLKQFAFIRFPESRSHFLKLSAWLVWLAALLGFSLLMFHPYYGGLVGTQPFLRLLAFWLFSLFGMLAFKTARPQAAFPLSLAATLLAQASLHVILSYFPHITDYPFALGWSETSRFYYPSLFISEDTFGKRHPWPLQNPSLHFILSIPYVFEEFSAFDKLLPSLHPSLHLLLVPPYLLDAPLWFHRAWQVIIRFVLVGAVAPALLSRFEVKYAPLRWLAMLWIFIFLFNLPLYLHLAVPILLILWGYSPANDRRTWLVVILASIWGGLSRINWYPMGGVLASLLYLLEVPNEQRNWRYMIKPTLWVIIGTIIAVATHAGYVAISGVEGEAFYTSLTSSLLWDRLWPNQTYWLGVLPASVLASLPLWVLLFFRLRSGPMAWNTLRGSLLVLGLAGLFAGGIVVSMKIGGGADIHNMDVYFIALLIAGGYAFFETGRRWGWPVLALLIIIPVWFAHFEGGRFKVYDPAVTSQTLARLQARVDEVNAGGGEMLFISQRHLISMGMLENARLVPEYEREDLMEMAMSENQVFLEQFEQDMAGQRFAAIVVDELKFNLLGLETGMGAENNAWALWVVRPILCYYEPAEMFPADSIVIYVPRVGPPACPTVGGN